MNQIKYFGPVNSMGVPQGYGRLLYPADDVRREYVGNFVNGKRHGYGILQWKDGCVYAGEWMNDVQRGWGKLRFGERDQFNRESYEGEWLDGKRSGKGTLIFRSSDRYEGEWKEDKYHGKGEFVWYGDCSGIKYKYQYIGEWINGRRNENVGTFKVTPLATGITRDIHIQGFESMTQNEATPMFLGSKKRKSLPTEFTKLDNVMISNAVQAHQAPELIKPRPYNPPNRVFVHETSVPEEENHFYLTQSCESGLSEASQSPELVEQGDPQLPIIEDHIEAPADSPEADEVEVINKNSHMEPQDPNAPLPQTTQSSEDSPEGFDFFQELLACSETPIQESFDPFHFGLPIGIPELGLF